MERIETIGKWVAVILAVSGFLWGVISALQLRAIDARRPFLDLQLRLYQEASNTAAILATSTDARELQVAEHRFWQLYWGELSMVENGGIMPKNGGVEGAMVRFGAELMNHPQSKFNLQLLSLDLAHICRDSLAQSWAVSDWRTPDYGSITEQRMSQMPERKPIEK